MPETVRYFAMSLNSPEMDDGYASRRYDVEWRSLKAGAILAVLVIAIVFLGWAVHA